MRSNKRGLKTIQSRKIENLSFSVFNYKSKLFKKRWNNIITTEMIRIRLFQWFYLWYKKTIIYKKINETGIFRFLALFSKMWKIGERYNVNKTEDKVEPCPTPMSTLEKGDKKLFQSYWVFLLTK